MNQRDYDKETPFWMTLKYIEGKLVSPEDGSVWTVGEWKEVSEDIANVCFKSSLDSISDNTEDFLAKLEIEKKFMDRDYPNDPSHIRLVSGDKTRVVNAWSWGLKETQMLALYIGEKTLKHFEKVYPEDKRPHTAIENTREKILHTNDMTIAAADSNVMGAWEAAWEAIANASESTREEGYIRWTLEYSKLSKDNGVLERYNEIRVVEKERWSAAWSALSIARSLSLSKETYYLADVMNAAISAEIVASQGTVETIDSFKKDINDWIYTKLK